MRSAARSAIGAAAALVALAALAVAASGAAAGDDGATERPDLKVALRSPSGACGPYGDDLPALIARSGLDPGATVADLVVCVTNRGRPARVDLFVRELVDVEAGCTHDEGTVDSTCGGEGGRGELSPSLRQAVGTSSASAAGSCASVPSVEGGERRLPELVAAPARIGDRVKNREVLCVRLVVRYDPNPAEAARSQSDRTTWRYVLTADDR